MIWGYNPWSVEWELTRFMLVRNKLHIHKYLNDKEAQTINFEGLEQSDIWWKKYKNTSIVQNSIIHCCLLCSITTILRAFQTSRYWTIKPLASDELHFVKMKALPTFCVWQQLLKNSVKGSEISPALSWHKLILVKMLARNVTWKPYHLQKFLH